MTNNSSKARAIRAFAVCLTLLLLLPLLAACMSGGNAEDEEERTLRIAYMYGDSNYDDYMRTQYTDIFQFTHKNITIELVPAVDWSKRRYDQPQEEGVPYKEPNPLEEMKKLMEGDNPPDLVFLGYDELAQLSTENLLQPLEPYIEKDEINLDEFVPSVINGLKAVGDNKLYALAPTFSSSALLYNKALFTDAGVEIPEDNMTWDQIWDLARRVSKGEGADRVYGFSFDRSYWSDLFWAMDTYVAPLGLRLYDENAEKMLVDDDQWEQVWKSLTALKKEKLMPEPIDHGQNMDRRPSPLDGDAFLSGKLAMTVTNYNQLSELISANNNAAAMEGFTPIEWDVVTLPTHDVAPGVGGFMYMDPIMAIPANAANSDDAWEFIKFLNSKEWAELKSRSLNSLVSRKEYIKPKDGMDYNIAAFYTLTPARSVMNNNNPELDPMVRQRLWEVNNIGQMKLNEVINNNKDVREALKEWQTQGDALLKQIKENPNPQPMETDGIKF